MTQQAVTNDFARRVTCRIARRVAHRAGVGRVVRGRPQAGFTLVEMLAVVGIMAIVFASVGVTLHNLARVNQRIRGELPQTQALTRFILRLRTDTHAALSAQLDTDRTSRLLLHYGSNSPAVEYEIQASTIVRRELREGEARRTDYFHLPRTRTLAWQVSQESPGTMVALLVELDSNLRAPLGQEMAVGELVAAVGLQPGRDE